MLCTVSLYLSIAGLVFIKITAPPLLSAMRIRLTDVVERSTKLSKDNSEKAQMSRDNLERFFSSAARSRASALRSVSVVGMHPLVQPLNPLNSRSSLSSALLFQPADSNLVASTTLV